MHTSIQNYLVYGIYKLRSEEGDGAVCCLLCVCVGGGGEL